MKLYFILFIAVTLSACSATREISEEALLNVWSKHSEPKIHSSSKDFEWVQPKNLKEKCLIQDIYQFEGDVHQVWDGGCKDGRAHGLGRVFYIIEEGDRKQFLASIIKDYKSSSGEPKLHYTSNYKENQIIFLNQKPSDEEYVFYSMTISNERPFDMVYLKSWVSLDSSLYYESNIASPNITGYMLSNGVAFTIFKDNSFQDGVAYQLFTQNLNRDSFGFAHFIGRDGAGVSFDVLNNEEVILPSLFFERFETVQLKLKQKNAQVDEAVESALEAIEKYKSRACSSKIDFEYVPNNMYHMICEDQGELHEYTSRIERRTRYTQDTQELNARRYFAKVEEMQRARQITAAGYQQFLSSLNQIGQDLSRAGQGYHQAAAQLDQNTQYNWAQPVQGPSEVYEYQYEYNPANNINVLQSFVRSEISNVSARHVCFYSKGATLILPIGQVNCPIYYNPKQ